MSATSQSEIAALCDERGINLGTRNYGGLMVRLALWEFGVANETDPLFTTLPTYLNTTINEMRKTSGMRGRSRHDLATAIIRPGRRRAAGASD